MTLHDSRIADAEQTNRPLASHAPRRVSAGAAALVDRAGRGFFAPLTVAGILLVGLTACTSDPQLGPRRGSGYMMEYEQANSLGYAVTWQSSAAVTLAGEATSVIPGHDVVVTTENGSNVISAVTARDGEPKWEQPLGDQLERLLGAHRQGNRLIASTQSDLYVLDVATGRVISDQRFGEQNIASSVPLVRGNIAIYGTDDGRIVYHNLDTGLMLAAYRIGAGITHPPIDAGPEAIAVVTAAGRINLMNPTTNTRYWEAGVLDTIVARPAMADTGIFVASTDQSLWAFRLADGQVMWRQRFEYPLIDDPTYIDNVIYLVAPNQGLIALDASTRQELWLAPDVAGGTVITMNDGDLIVFDQEDDRSAYGSTFYRVDARTGDVLATVETDWIHYAASTSMENGTIFGLSRAGRLIRLDP